MTLEQIFIAVTKELVFARGKFPNNKHLLHAFQEEAGEVTREFLENQYGKGTNEQVIKELIQTMAMACRLIQEGDPDLDQFIPCGGK